MTDAAGDASVAALVAAYVARRPGWVADGPLPSAGSVRVVHQQVLVPGRPGVQQVLAQVGDRLVHVLVGLRAPADEARFVAGCPDPVLGLHDDADGLAVAFDALADEETATAVLEHVVAMASGTTSARWVGTTADRVGLRFDDHVALTVVDALGPGADAWLSIRAALARSGSTEVPAPVALWRHGDQALGLVDEVPPAGSTGWHQALLSLRALLDGGQDPDRAVEAFAAEATAVGATVGRLHVALDAAFGRWPADPAAWAVAVDGVVRRHAPGVADRADVRRALDHLAAVTAPGVLVRGFGALSLERVCRTDAGWVVTDDPLGTMGAAVDHDGVGPAGPVGPAGSPRSQGPGGPADGAARGVHAGSGPAGASPPGALTAIAGAAVAGELRSPLADVADLLWSLGQVATAAVAERGAADDAMAERVAAWERRCRRALVAGYLAVPGVAALVPSDRAALRTVTAVFELARAVRHGVTAR